MDNRLQTSLFPAGFGAFFFFVGLWTVWTSWSEPPSPVSRLPVIDTRALAIASVGSEVIIEGRLAASTPLLREGLALYQIEVAKGFNPPGSNEIRFSFQAEVTEAPPFQIETLNGSVGVQLALEASWDDAPRIVENNPGSVSAGKQRLRGFAPSDRLTVQGEVVAGPLLRARVIRGGTAADYMSQVKNTGRVGLILGAVFALVGLGTLVAAAWQARGVLKIR